MGNFTVSLTILKILYTALFALIAAWNSFLKTALVSQGERRSDYRIFERRL